MIHSYKISYIIYSHDDLIINEEDEYDRDKLIYYQDEK